MIINHYLLKIVAIANQIIKTICRLRLV